MAGPDFSQVQVSVHVSCLSTASESLLLPEVLATVLQPAILLSLSLTTQYCGFRPSLSSGDPDFTVQAGWVVGKPAMSATVVPAGVQRGQLPVLTWESRLEFPVWGGVLSVELSLKHATPTLSH